MKKLLVLSLFLFGCSDGAVIVEKNPCAEFTAENFPAEKIFSGISVPVNMQTYPAGDQFRQYLLERGSSTPNFAGSYEVISWECGETCQRRAIVDVRTGRIIFLPLESQFGAEFSVTSRVLTLNPPQNLPSFKKFPEEIRTQYWLMEGGEDDIATEFSLGCEANLRKP
jgi:hypothetical protein